MKHITKSMLFFTLFLVSFIVGLNQNMPGWSLIPSMILSLIFLALGIVNFKDHKLTKEKITKESNRSVFLATLIVVLIIGIGLIYLAATSQ